MKKILVLLIILTSTFVFADVKVVATTTIIHDLVKNIGKDKVDVDYICRGNQDPHFVEVMPSYMLKLRNADIVFKIGLDLEKWLPQLIDGSRNTNLEVIDLSKDIEKLEVPTTKMDARYGDVHPYGNPHYYLDPIDVKIMAKEIFDALATQDPENTAYYKKNYEAYLKKLNTKIEEWNRKMTKVKGEPIVFFHSSWIYFANQYGIKIAGYVEPKPGIPPTPSHNADVINLIKKGGIKLIVMENYYSDSAPNQIAGITGAKVIKVPVGIYGMDGIDSYFQMMDYIIDQIVNNS
ncbi:MAG TPA: metal ABC transporter substrate-binding protein [Ignavibacteriaceae bacterium]|nr:metal ABC transporter substrate-binding protein [Ignavibacteriaceae bacterium]